MKIISPIAALIIANIIWGAAPPIFKFALENIPPFTLAFIRFFFASFLFIPFIGPVWKKMTMREFLLICLGSLFGVTLNISAFFLGLQKTVSINAPIIASAGPVFLFFLSVFFLKEKAHTKIFIGMLISLIGILFIVLSPIFLDGKHLVLGEIEGNLLFVLATLGSVISTVIYKSILERINAFQVALMSFLISSLTFAPGMVWELKQWSFFELNMQGWIGILFGVFLCSALAYYLYYYGLSKLLSQEIGLFTYIDPVVAVLIAAPLLAEYPTIYFFIGSLLVFGGIYIAEKRIHYHPIHRLKRV